MTVHSFAHAGFTGLGNQARREKLRDEVVEVVVGLENDVAAASAVAAAGAAFWPKRFAQETRRNLFHRARLLHIL